MQDTITHLAHAAAWVFGFIFLFAAIGVIATIRWIFSLFFKAEKAVEGGIHSAGDMLHRR